MRGRDDIAEREENNRAYHRNQVELQKVRATREQTAEMRLLREAVERLAALLIEAKRP